VSAPCTDTNVYSVSTAFASFRWLARNMHFANGLAGMAA
jgi:hypothetical protein